MNQNTQVHAIANHLQTDFDCYFTPAYIDHGIVKTCTKMGLADFTVLGERFRLQALDYFNSNNLQIDEGGRKHRYDLVVVTSDLVVPKNILNTRRVLVQEGMTDPETVMYHIVRKLKLPRYLASTATQGLSNLYDIFCVGSEGYKKLFISKGVDPTKIRVTGIPNYDNVKQFLNNDFPYKNYVLVATSDTRETMKFVNHKKFVKNVAKIAAGRPIIFKLHPNEKVERSSKLIKSIIPDARIFSTGNTDHMIANCDVLITQYSTVVYIGIALGKEVHSYFDVDTLRELAPIQNDGQSAQNIAELCREIIVTEATVDVQSDRAKQTRFRNHRATTLQYADRYSRTS